MVKKLCSTCAIFTFAIIICISFLGCSSSENPDKKFSNNAATNSENFVKNTTNDEAEIQIIQNAEMPNENYKITESNVDVNVDVKYFKQGTDVQYSYSDVLARDEMDGTRQALLNAATQLGVPESSNITYLIGDIAEYGGIEVVPINFFEDYQLCAGALCDLDGNLIANVVPYA